MIDKLSAVIDNLPDAVILVEIDGRVTLANARVETLLGLDASQIERMPVGALLEHPGLQFAARLGFSEAVLLNVVEQMAVGEGVDPVLVGERKRFEINVGDEIHHIERKLSFVHSERGDITGLLLVFSDVTSERQLVQARADFSSMIVHDLRGPLTAITTSLRLLNEIVPPETPLGGPVNETTQSALLAVRKLSRLIDTLQDASKLESNETALERDLAYLNTVCDPVIDELAPLAEELDISLLVNLPEDLPLLDIDADKIERVLLNLIDNGIKFTPAGGEVVVAAHLPDSAGDAAFVRVDVCDTGPGVSDEQKIRLFDRFALRDRRAGRRRKPGLGLIFCKLAVEAHGGRIWIEDNPAGGAIVAFTLPIARVDQMTEPLEDD